MAADIKKMYWAVELAPADRDLHRFVWRANEKDDLKDYRMTTVTFGVTASPFAAIRALQQTAIDFYSEHPISQDHVKTLIIS